MSHLAGAIQPSLFPWMKLERAEERYNREAPSPLMTASSPDLDPQALGSILAAALADHLRGIAAGQGLRIAPARIQEASGHLVGIVAARGGKSRTVELSRVTCTEESFAPHDYLHLVPEQMRRALGQVMTPQPIVRYILSAAGYLSKADILGRTLCDPACGSGVFLIEAVRTYLAALRRIEAPLADWYPRVRESFVGIDVDPLACLYARFNLSLLLGQSLLAWMQANPRRHPEPLPVYELDTLETLAAERRHISCSDLTLESAFDYVIGNPPYRKLGRIADSLRIAFQGSLYGHPNAYGMFLHAGIDMLRPGGRLGFIIPRSMLSGLYFQNLRRMIEERTHLEELSLLAERKNVFPQVLQGTMILVFRKRAAAPDAGVADTPIRTGIIRSAAELGNGGPAHVTIATEKVARRLNGTTIWFVSDQERTYSLLDKILGHHPLLGGPVVACPARTGPIVWNRLKPHLRSEGGDGRLPLVWATDVGRFRFRFAAAGDSRPAYLEEIPKTRGLATAGPSLLVQRVTADEQAHRIVASHADFPLRRRYFVENHLNVLQPALASGVDLRYLLGILSSDVVEFLFRSMNGNTQVSATELNLLPVPRGPFEPEIVSLTSALERAGKNDRSDLEGELNERVARTYGLTLRDLGFLQRILRENPALREIQRDD